jgi:phenylacetate-coenzyme A ligase PaaK-like adenylate-forming protein
MTWRLSSSLDIGLHRRLALAATMPIGELVEQLNRFQPEGFNSYPSVAALLAEEQLEGRLRISPSSVAMSSELCTPEMRDRIRAAWGTEPFEVYGATDGLWGWHCEHHRLHFAEDITIVEVVDEEGRPVPDGEAGHRLLVTNLFMKTQPIIRYEITDMVRLHEDPCPCGRPTRTVEAIEGRSDDILEVPADAGGTVRVHPITLRSPLAHLRSIRQYQLVLRDDGLHGYVVPRGDAAAATAMVQAALVDALRAAGASRTAVRVETVDAVERDANAVGKLKLVRSELGGQASASMLSRT